MFRGIAVLWAMAWHYIINTPGRRKYSVQGKELDTKTKKEYRAKVFYMAKDLSQRMVKAADATIEVKGRGNLPTEGPVVYMVTHKGLFDCPVMACLLDDPIIFIGKEEMAKMPIINKWFDAMGCIYLVRDDMKKSLQAILEGVQELKNGQSIVIFPEGTRSRSKEMGEFKAGSFKLATKANVPIIPIAIQNTHKILEEKGGIQKATVYVNVGEMIDVAALSNEEKKQLPTTVENTVRELLSEITE